MIAVHRPKLALLVALALTIGAIVLMFRRLQPETSFAGMFDRSDRAVIALGRVLEQFPVGNELLVLVASDHPDPARLIEFAERLRGAIERDTESRSLVTHVRYRADPRTRAFFEEVVVPNGLHYLNDAQIAELKQRLTRDGMRDQLARTQATLAQPGPAAGGLAKTLAKDPLRLHEFLTARFKAMTIPGAGAVTEAGGAFLSPDRRSLLIRVGGAKSPNDFNFARDLTSAIARVAKAENRDGFRIDIAGAYAMSAHSAARIKADCIADIVTTVVGLVVLFTIACRRPIQLFTFAFVPVAIGIVWGFGIYAIVRQTITPLAAVVGGTLGAIGLDYTIHFIAHFQEVLGSGVGAKDAVLRTRRELVGPSLAAWATSVIGFAACAISPIQTLRDFAILGTLCLAGAWGATLFVLPAMLMIWPRASFAIRFETAGAIGRWIARNARGVLVCSTVAIAAICVPFIKPGVRLELDSDPMAMHPQPSPPLEAQRKIARMMQTAGGSLIVHLRASSSSELVSLAHDVQSRLKTNSFGLASLVPDPRGAKPQAAVDIDQTQEDFRAALSESGFVPEAYESYLAFLKKLALPGAPPDADVLRNYGEFGQLLLPRDAGSNESVVLLFTDVPLETRDAREAALDAVRDEIADLPGATVTGTVAIGHDIELAIQRDLPRFLGVAIVCIAAFLLIHFRSIAQAAMALVPIAISLLAVVSCISLFGIKLTLLHTVMAPLLLGINLDYGIFAVHAWRRSRDAREVGEDFPSALSALIICGGSTTIGFGSLIVTSIPAIKSLGWLVNVGVGSCVLATLFVLWPIILRSSGGDGWGRAAPRGTQVEA